MVETETISFKIQSHLFFTMMKSMSKNIILIVKIVFFFGRGSGVSAWKGKETKAFLLLVAILPVFLIYNTWIKAYHTKDKDGNDIIKTILFWNVLKCQPKITNWELLGKGTLEEYSSICHELDQNPNGKMTMAF